FQLRRKRNLAQPEWLGAYEIGGKAILLHAEGSVGGTVQFCRYVPLVAERAARRILEVQPPPHGAMSAMPVSAAIVSRGVPPPAFDIHCPLHPLPLAFGTRLETIPAATPYLHASSQAMMNWNARLGPRDRPRIGLVWSGNPKNNIDHSRSMTLSSLL